MATPNFARPINASKYFVVLTSKEEKQKVCPECDEIHHEWGYDLEDLKQCESCKEDLSDVEITEKRVYPDEWEVDDFISNIGYSIEAIGGIKENESFRDRKQSLGTLIKSKSYGDVELEVIVTSILQSAYYEGATLDYIIHLEANGKWFDISTGSWQDQSLDDILEIVFDWDYSDMNKGLCTIMQPKAKNWVENTITELSEKIEEIFEQYTKHKLQCKGVFSNGEAVYASVS